MENDSPSFEENKPSERRKHELEDCNEIMKAKKKKKKKKKDKKKKKEKRPRSASDVEEETTFHASKKPRSASQESLAAKSSAERLIVESSALVGEKAQEDDQQNVTLLLFYQYVEPPWSNDVYKYALSHVEQLGKNANITGRMRVAREGLNCTLTGTREGILTFCRALREWKPECFSQTEFKLTHHLPEGQRFPFLKIIPVTELVHYGLDGSKAPPIQQYQGTHLEPKEYHKKLAEDNTVVIDVRNHYEASIGRFDPPPAPTHQKWIDPKMRVSTEFPVWLDDPKTQEQLQNKQVLMYCTGGIRCERASALLKYKMETDPQVKSLNIQGVYQLQGGIDKYFKEFPDGGYWRGKNYVFDKRFAHAPPEKEAPEHREPPVGRCEACRKPWDKYRGKRRCPTCGVPSLICRDCWQAEKDGIRKLDWTIRCDLCVEQNVRSKKELRAKAERDIAEYEARLRARGLLEPSKQWMMEEESAPNPDGVTRLFLKNMCRKNMTEEVLMEFLPGITHIVWRTDRKTRQFFGQGWVEMESPEAAGRAVHKSGEKVLGRPLFIVYQPPDGKDLWPPPSSAIRR